MEALLVFWLVCGIAAAVIGSSKGAGCSSFLLGLLLGPIGIVIAIFTKGNRKQCPSCREWIDPAASRCPKCQQDLTPGSASASRDSAHSSVENETKKCPACAEYIKLEAIKCRFCGYQYDPNSVGAVLAERKAAFDRTLKTKGFVSQEGLPGDAFCLGCRATGPRSQMLYNQGTDTFYHVGCLPK